MTMATTTTPCPFCHPDPDRVFYQGRTIFGLWDRFPVSPDHALLVTRRHVGNLVPCHPLVLFQLTF